MQYYEDEVQQIVACDGFACVWSGVNDVDLWGPAEDPHTGNRVITSGRVSFEETVWKKGEELTHLTGGLSSRILLQRFNKDGIDGILGHNGPGIVIVWDNSKRQLHLLTDHLGYHPVFLYRKESIDKCIISTSPDVIAQDPGAEVTLDPVSLAEFFTAWRATPPNTYYNEIKYAGVAAHHVWDLRAGTHSVREYWRPFQDGFYRDIHEASEALQEALESSIRIRTSGRLGPVLCFTSGGLDSRAVLFNASSDSELIGLNLYDVPGRDARVAQALCAATDTRYVGFGRDRDYYPRFMQENARVGNGMWSLEDQHYLGTRDVVRALGAKTVLTACTTDWVFKGYGLEKTYRRLFGRNLPIQKLVSERVDAFLPNHRLAVSEDYRRPVEERYRSWTGDLPRHLGNDTDWLLAEERRVRPACYAVSVSGAIMYRAFPYDTFLGDPAIAHCYSRIRAEWKLNSRIWGMTVRRMGGGAGRLPDSGSGFAPGDSSQMQIVKFGAGWIKRRLPSFRGSRNGADSIVANGSWPNLGWCIRNSETISRIWHDAPNDHRELLNTVAGRNLWAEDLDSWSRKSHDCFRILTLLNWLRIAR